MTPTPLALRARQAAFALLTLLALFTGLAALRYGLPEIPGAPPLPNLSLQRDVLLLHALSSGLALMLGPWQLMPRLRTRWPGLHRGMGYFYVLTVGLGSVTGLALAPQSMGGPVAHAGFGLLGLLWLGCTLAAVQQARRCRFDAHRRWMLRSFALTAAGISLRLQLGLAGALGVPVPEIYTAVAWACWLPQAVGLELWLRRGGRKVAER